MPSIAYSVGGSTTTVSFITLKGQVQPVSSLAVAVEEVTRVGVHGHAFRQDAQRGNPFDLLGVRDCESLANLDVIWLQCLAARGRQCTVVSDLGITHAKVMCLDVVKLDGRKIAGGAGGVSVAKGALLVVRFSMLMSKAA